MITARKKNLTRDQVLEILRIEFPYIKERFGIRRMAIFGSFAKGKITPRSDVDVYVVKGDKPLGYDFFDLCDYLEAKLGRDVDVLTQGGVRGIRIKEIARDIKQSLIYV